MIDISPLGHAIAAITLQAIVGLTLGMWGTGTPLVYRP